MNTPLKHLGITLLIASLAGTTIAAEPDADDSTLLKGPEVVETTGPDAGDTMTGSRVAKERTGDIPFRNYLTAVRMLNKAAEENPSLALTEEQEESIREIALARQAEMRAFMEEHKEEIQELRAARDEPGKGRGLPRLGRKKDRGAPPPPPGDEMGDPMTDDAPRANRARQNQDLSPEERQRMRERLADLMAQAPSDQEAKKQLWTVLTEEQQLAVKENIKSMREQRQRRVDEAMQSERKGKDGQRGDRKQRAKERKGDEQGFDSIENPIFDIDVPLPNEDDC